MKSGINASIQLDIMKDAPDFLLPESDVNYPYVYAHSDITVIDGRMANVISFEQRDFINSPLLKGTCISIRKQCAAAGRIRNTP